jgi:hypothetical protein
MIACSTGGTRSLKLAETSDEIREVLLGRRGGEHREHTRASQPPRIHSRPPAGGPSARPHRQLRLSTWTDPTAGSPATRIVMLDLPEGFNEEDIADETTQAQEGRRAA